MNARAALLACGMLLPGLSSAGDYWLVVQDDPAATCASSVGAPTLLKRTSAEMAAEMERTLTVRGAGISGWLSNGFMSYCGARERRAAQDALLRLARHPARFVDESWWQTFVWRARTPDLPARVERELARADLPPRGRARLERLRETLRSP